MEYCIVIPAYNEQDFIALTLESLVEQTVLPKKVIVVNDSSTDKTKEIIEGFQQRFPWIHIVDKASNNIHMPGSKVIQAFNEGLKELDESCDLIVKLDADLILPSNYFEEIINVFKADDTVGMAGGFAYIEKDSKWIEESLTDKDHIRGAFKSYRKELFFQMGGLKEAMGWDTVDELLCRFYGWKIVTLPKLKVKHLKPTGANYDKKARYKQGEAFYRLHYGFVITFIASAKLALKKRNLYLFFDYLKGFIKAKKEGQTYLVTDKQGEFIRNYRWKKIKSKLF